MGRRRARAEAAAGFAAWDRAAWRDRRCLCSPAWYPGSRPLRAHADVKAPWQPGDCSPWLDFFFFLNSSTGKPFLTVCPNYPPKSLLFDRGGVSLLLSSVCPFSVKKREGQPLLSDDKCHFPVLPPALVPRPAQSQPPPPTPHGPGAPPGQHGGPATAPKHHNLKQRDQKKEKPAHVIADSCPVPTANGRAMPRSSPPCSRIPRANPRGSICFIFQGKPYINFKNSLPEKSADNARSSINFPTTASEPERLSASFPNALVGFIAFLHLLSNLCSEHFCPRLFILVFFQDSQSCPSGSGSTSVGSTIRPYAAAPSPGMGKMLHDAPSTLLRQFNHHFTAADTDRQQAFGFLREHMNLQNQASGLYPFTDRETEARDTCFIATW